ncbi:hypothetical protein QFZ63_001626 [Streptomyces sp. B3I7]|uniref:hypothetical protein n=1 Tax=Streptomyces sp. B3I7 TaxID=3042269 RepID=UPI002781FC3C|nr:hypothetical protein [Streptomyces sp. B3I7]MDQ0809912.1 hypothetical protein [Streptomyces sp. B3I7]
MTADLAALPPTPTGAGLVIVPGLLTGLGITRRPVPRWITNPDLIASIETGLTDIDDLLGDNR